MSAAEKTEDTQIFLFSPSGRLVSASGEHSYARGISFNEIFQSEQDLFPQLFSQEDQQVEAKFTNTGEQLTLTTHIMTDPGGNKLGLIISSNKRKTGSDSSSFKNVDDKIIRMDRLAQVGQLAASIAHEIRNPLAGINANIQVLSDMLKEDEQSGKFFAVILEEIQRVEKIIKDLLDYAKSAKPELKPVRLDNVFEHVKTLVSAQLNKKKIKLIISDDNIEKSFFADFGQLIQVFLNCIMNASDAMPSGGNIAITTGDCSDHIEISIKDNGIGIKKELLDQIFNPFFTTRTKGLGLGLSVIRKIMDDHHGDIKINSTPGEGTEIILIFPVNNWQED